MYYALLIRIFSKGEKSNLEFVISNFNFYLNAIFFQRKKKKDSLRISTAGKSRTAFNIKELINHETRNSKNLELN